jgi:hypothetical protein
VGSQRLIDHFDSFFCKSNQNTAAIRRTVKPFYKAGG